MLFKVAFFIVRLLVGLGAAAILAGTLVVFLFENLLALLKTGVGVLVAVVTVFASGFQKSPDAPAPSTVISLGLVGIAIAFLSVFASIFMPGQKIFLHVVAAMMVAVAVWDLHRASTLPSHDVLFMPVIVVWFIYYGMCLLRRA